MRTYTIKDTITGWDVCSGAYSFEVAEKLRELFADAPDEVLDACAKYAEAFERHEPTYEYEAYLGVEIVED